MSAYGNAYEAVEDFARDMDDTHPIRTTFREVLWIIASAMKVVEEVDSDLRKPGSDIETLETAMDNIASLGRSAQQVAKGHG